MNIKPQREFCINLVLTAESHIGLYQENRYLTDCNYAKSSFSLNAVYI